MLLKNTGKLVNGLLGHVVSLGNDYIEVYFSAANSVARLKREMFSSKYSYCIYVASIFVQYNL